MSDRRRLPDRRASETFEVRCEASGPLGVGSMCACGDCEAMNRHRHPADRVGPMSARFRPLAPIIIIPGSKIGAVCAP
jgi:hypothetical protein